MQNTTIFSTEITKKLIEADFDHVLAW